MRISPTLAKSVRGYAYALGQVRPIWRPTVQPRPKEPTIAPVATARDHDEAKDALVVPRVMQTQAAERNSLAPRVVLELTTVRLTGEVRF
jgi:hypothetical protein